MKNRNLVRKLKKNSYTERHVAKRFPAFAKYLQQRFDEILLDMALKNTPTSLHHIAISSFDSLYNAGGRDIWRIREVV
jgi:beta-glucosidase/6-phospho-beta-glucosidase/beta-galactosidase